MLNIPTANALQEAASSMVSQGVGELLAQFTAAFKQTNRLLRLHTPLGPNVLLAESLKGIETISGAAPAIACDITGYQLQIDALSTKAHLQLKALIGQPILLEIQTDQSRDELRPLHGYVTAAVAIGSNGGMARYRLTVQPWLAFLGAGRDSAVFQDMNVLTIVQSILTDYQSTLQGVGKLQPLWRLDVQDAAAYPIRSLTTQYQESDLQFINRLLLEEGLFYWFEHTGDPANASLGNHTLVIADHNGAFKPLQLGLSGASTIRFSQSKGVIADDIIDVWSPQSSWGTHAVDIASWDYRSLSVRPVSEHAAIPEGTPALTIQDTPGAYAYESAAQGQRLARNHSQALQIASHSLQAAGTVRALAPGQTFSLTGHAGSLTATPEHVVLHVIHHARNNLSAQLKATSATLPSSPSSDVSKLINTLISSNAKEDIFYRNAALVLPLATAYRASHTNGHGQLIHPKPSASGSQTALVIGVEGQHLTTDRDHRVKVQFAWQRGASSQSRLAHPAADGHSGAPAADGSASTTGTWVRVATPLAPIAGANWGSVALPRIGQEVLVTFLGGDIDRPVIIGSLYNGQGADNAQSNQVQQGAANATGNAPMWFPGDQEASGKQGKLPGHAHNAVLSGIKTQALSASQTGQGGYNQIVFDDTPGQSRLGLQSHGKLAGSHAGETELNLGALRQQTDNQRLGTVGYGFELKTHYSGAIRSGSGLLISADKRSGNESGSASAQMDSKEAFSQLQTGQDLIKSLTDTAQQHKAMLPVLKTTEVKPDKLPAFTQLEHNGKVIQAKASGSEGQYALSTSGTAIKAASKAPPEENCDWIEAQGQHARPDSATYAKRTQRPYNLVDTGIVDTLNLYNSNGCFMIYEVCFEDGTSALLYKEDSPAITSKTVPWMEKELAEDSVHIIKHKTTKVLEFDNYTVEQVAQQIARMPQQQLQAVDRFVIMAQPEVEVKIDKRHGDTSKSTTLGAYGMDGDTMYIYPQPKGGATDEQLALVIMHEGGHVLEDLWMGVTDAWVRLGEQIGALRKQKLNSFESMRQQSKKVLQTAEQLKNPQAEQLPTQAVSALELAQKHKAHKKTTLGRVIAGVKCRKAWKKAARADAWWVSTYSQTNWQEDFAEHCATYMLSYGTCCEQVMRANMPHRAKLLDEYFKQKENAPCPETPEQKQRREAFENIPDAPPGEGGNPSKDEGSSQPSGTASGGGGETPAYSDPLMVMSAPAGIALLTPQSASFNAGTTTSIAAGQDINLLAQANAAHMVKAGISLFTYGKASNPKKPNQEVGISLHAASGKVSSQSQSDKTQITADKGIQVNSTTDAVQIQAPKHVLLTAQGAYIKMSGGNIEVHAPGKVDFKAGMKSWTSAKSDSNSLSLAKSKVGECASAVAGAASGGAAFV